MYIHLLRIRKQALLVIFAFIVALLLAFSSFVVDSTFGTKNVSAATAKEIVVSTEEQTLYAYENGALVYTTLVVTGRESLPTPLGTFHVFAKLSPTTFTSPWPKSSPNWYPPTHINYALEFKAGGFFLHDATWLSVFGPGANGWHYDSQAGWREGSHGCVGMPLDAAAWLYQWAPIGTTVNIN